MTNRLIFSALVVGLLAGPAWAQSTGTAAPSPDKAALSKSCSTQADAKGLHGKVRKHFRSQCKHGKT